MSQYMEKGHSMEKTVNTYKTSDIYLAAFLKAKGMKCGTRVTFIFDDQPVRKIFVVEFFNDGVVSIGAYRNAIQDLKTIVFNA
jgi:hypothetical protein